MEALDGERILITGATGLIGQALVRKAVKLGMNVLALVRNMNKAYQLFNDYETVTLLQADMTHLPLEDMNVSYIIHAAAETSSRAFGQEPVRILIDSLHGMERVLEYGRLNRIKSLVFLSSMEVYGLQQTDEKIGELHNTILDTMNPRSSYPESKRACEALCTAYWEQFGVPAKVVRLTQTFGTGVQYDDGRVFAEFARCAIEKRDIILHTKGETCRCYLELNDAVEAIFTVLTQGQSGEAYNAANEDTYCSIYDMACFVADVFTHGHINVLVQEEDISKFGYAPRLHMNLDTRKLQSLGWQPQKGLKEMFSSMIESMCTS